MSAPSLQLMQLQDPVPSEATGFSCNDAGDLRDFLVNDALKYVKQGLARVYLGWQGIHLVGFFSLSCGLVRYEELSKEVKADTGLDATNSARTAPVILLGRLAVDERFRGQGIGMWLFDQAITIARFLIAPHVGCRFLLIDAKYERIGWYEGKLGCRVLGGVSIPPRTTRMGFDLSPPQNLVLPFVQDTNGSA